MMRTTASASGLFHRSRHANAMASAMARSGTNTTTTCNNHAVRRQVSVTKSFSPFAAIRQLHTTNKITNTSTTNKITSTSKVTKRHFGGPVWDAPGGAWVHPPKNQTIAASNYARLWEGHPTKPEGWEKTMAATYTIAFAMLVVATRYAPETGILAVRLNFY